MKSKFNSRRQLIVGATCLLSTPLMAGSALDVILDGYAYEVNSDITFDVDQQIINIDQSNMTNCQRPGGFLPLDDVNISLQTNSQSIGITNNQYFFAENLYVLTSQTSDVICDNGVYVDDIFVNGFEEPISPFLIFKDGFEN